MVRRTSNPPDRAPCGEGALGPGDATFLQFAHALCLADVVEFLVTLLDVSPSMLTDDLKPSRLEVACTANRKLITTKAAKHPEDLVGVIAFGGEAHLLHEPVVIGNSTRSLLRSRTAPQCIDWTDFHAALSFAESVLFAQDRDGTTTKARNGMAWLLAKLVSGDGSAASKVDETSPGGRWVRRIVLLSDGERSKGAFTVADSGASEGNGSDH
jgi:hypothetical protein